MTSKRPTILAAVLLVLLAAYLGWPHLSAHLAATGTVAAEPALPGANAITAVTASRGADGKWTATVEYFYTGDPAGASLRVGAFNGPAAPAASDHRYPFAWQAAKRGTQRLDVELPRPNGNEAIVTKHLAAELLGRGQPLATAQVAQTIDWPTFETWVGNLQAARMTPAQNLERAVALIDSGERGGVEQARAILVRLLTDDPRLAAAYVELARVAMKTNWGPAGLAQAETYLRSALDADPGSANAKVLMGYVYAHQGRHKQAEALLQQAASAGTPNQWLWVNWGELLEMQGRKEAAAAKYREALTRPRTHDTYDRARQEAYRRLVALLVQRKDLSGAEAVYQQQLADFGAGNCFVAEYARFMLEERGDTDKAIQLARDLLEQRCTDIHTREVLGMAHYVKWAGATETDKADALNRALVHFPISPKLLYSLANSDRTARAVKSLAVAGHAVDLKDNDGFTALAYAFNFRNHPAAARLLALGARGDAKIGPEQVPLGLMVVINGDVRCVALLQRHGVNVARLEFRGMTALEYARRTGDRRMVEALEPRRQST